jgi:phage shock protein C
MVERRLYRSRDDRMIAGVCGGLAKYFGVDPTVIRLIAVLTIIFGGAGILAYIILALVVPLESSQSSEPRDVIRENVEEMKNTAEHFGEDMKTTFEKKEGQVNQGRPAEPRHYRHHGGGYFVAVLLIVIGVLFLFGTLFGRFFWWLQWQYLWPLILIVIGLLIIVGVRRR